MARRRSRTRTGKRQVKKTTAVITAFGEHHNMHNFQWPDFRCFAMGQEFALHGITLSTKTLYAVRINAEYHEAEELFGVNFPGRAIKIQAQLDEVVDLFQGTIVQVAPSTYLVEDADCWDFNNLESEKGI